jgi:arylsulfatase A-like enzyme
MTIPPNILFITSDQQHGLTAKAIHHYEDLLPVPRNMSGADEKAVWTGEMKSLREHVLIENQHQPTTMNMRTLITDRYKLTVYFNQPYGELYDLSEDPGERVNLWEHPEHAELKSELLLRFIHAEMARAPLPMPRIAGA